MPPQQEMPLWARVVKARFPACYIDPAAWVLVFDADLGDEWSPEEIIETANWMQSQGQKWSAVECAKDIVVAVWTYRKAKREGWNVPVEACDYCRGGWLDSYPELTPEHINACPDLADAVEIMAQSYRCMIPCRCDKGNQLMRKCSDYNRMDPEKEHRVGAQREHAYKLAGAVRRKEMQTP